MQAGSCGMTLALVWTVASWGEVGPASQEGRASSELGTCLLLVGTVPVPSGELGEERIQVEGKTLGVQCENSSLALARTNRWCG